MAWNMNVDAVIFYQKVSNFLQMIWADGAIGWVHYQHDQGTQSEFVLSSDGTVYSILSPPIILLLLPVLCRTSLMEYTRTSVVVHSGWCR